MPFGYKGIWEHTTWSAKIQHSLYSALYSEVLHVKASKNLLVFHSEDSDSLDQHPIAKQAGAPASL